MRPKKKRSVQIKEYINKIEQKSNVVNKIIEPIRGQLHKNDERYTSDELRMQTFQMIYKDHIWGEGDDFYSGIGSHDESVVQPYVNLINQFIREKEIKTVVDIGCGDFAIGRKIANDSIRYIGVDIVPELIERNNAKFGNDHIKFMHKDIVKEKVPDAELYLIREVFQHLSIQEVQRALVNIKGVKYCIITESLVKGGKYNRNKPHGSFSGFYLEEEPFHLKVKRILTLDHPNESDNELVCYLVEKEEG